MKRTSPIVSALLISLALAGCTTDGGHDDGHDHAITEDSFRVKVTGAPAHVDSGNDATFTVTIEAVDGAHTSTTHLGAHYWSQSTDDPNGDFGLAGGCTHVQGETDVPGSFDVTCSGLEDGMHFLRGHLRLTVGEDVLNFWSEEFAIHFGPMS